MLSPNLLLSIPELGLGATGSVRIPELQNVPTTARIRELIDHPAFQRLRRIRQLGPTHLVYPGATHTRFEHSLGVYACTILYMQSLLRNNAALRDSLSEEDVMAVLLAGLLHDLGHYPYAHSLEALHLKGRDTPKHENVGAEIIRGNIEHLRGELSIGELIRSRFGVDPERVIALSSGLGPRATQTDKVLRSVISSAIDADKMDYLERDSIHLGVPYGRNYDRERLLSSLTLNTKEDRVALLARGKVSAEIFIFGRYTMFSEAYWHHTVRSASAMLEAGLAAFHSRTELGVDEQLEILLRRSDDEFLDWLVENSPDPSAARYLIEALSGNRRQLYKRIATFSRVYQETTKQRAYERIYSMSSSEVYDLVDRLRARISGMVGWPLHPADIIIDTPPRDKDKLETVGIVYPDASGKKEYPLHELSRVIAGVQDDFMMVVKKIRIFAHPRVAGALVGEEKLEKAILSEVLK